LIGPDFVLRVIGHNEAQKGAITRGGGPSPHLFEVLMSKSSAARPSVPRVQKPFVPSHCAKNYFHLPWPSVGYRELPPTVHEQALRAYLPDSSSLEVEFRSFLVILGRTFD
jgi:hypothetical protein